MRVCGSPSLWLFREAQGLQIVSGNGHFRVNNRDLVVIDVRKPNSKGADFSVEQVNRMFHMLGEYLNVDPTKNKQVFVNANRWTPVGLETQGCVETVDNNIVNYPSPELTMRPVVATEVRSADMCAVIKCVYPRNGEQQAVTLSSVDPNKTNQRSLSIKHQIDRINMCCKCTNTMPADMSKNEEFKTMLAVIHTMVPGSPAYFTANVTSSSFNDVRCDKTQSRPRIPDEGPRKALLVTLLPLAHVLASTLVALPNRSGIIPFDISHVSLAFLDWIFLYVRTHLSSILDVDVLESFSRMKVRRQVFLVNHPVTTDSTPFRAGSFSRKGTKVGMWHIPFSRPPSRGSEAGPGICSRLPRPLSWTPPSTPFPFPRCCVFSPHICCMLMRTDSVG